MPESEILKDTRISEYHAQTTTVKGHESTPYQTLSGCDFIVDNMNDTYLGQAVSPAKGHESKSYKMLSSSVGLFFNFTIVKMKGQINEMQTNSAFRKALSQSI